MLQRDIDALNAHFFDNMGSEELQLVVENQPDEDFNDNELWSKWIINPGLSTQTTMGPDPTITQYGSAILQIFVPKGLYTGPGNDLRDQFNNLFRGWRSADRKLTVDDLKSTSSTYNRGKSEFHLINAMFFWHSKRRSSDV